MPATALHLISSMATRRLLVELTQLHGQLHPGQPIQLEAVGGVDAARRVQAGEPFDVVLLGSDSIDHLMADGHVLAGTRVDVVRSEVSVAVRAGAPQPDIGSAAALRHAVLSARTVGCSTGPSGVALGRLFEDWGIAGQIRDKLVVAPPGTPVGALIASGEIELGFQQRSELMDLPGIDVIGPLPESVRITTIFAGAVGTRALQPDAALAFLAFLAEPATIDIKRANGMDVA